MKKIIYPLKLYIIENNIKQKEIAKLCGVSQITINRIVNYKMRPRLSTAKSISAVTGIPVIDLLYPEESCNKK